MHLYINDYPSRLTRDAGMFSIKNEEGETRFSPLQLSSICMTRACMVSTDALMLASKHNIPVLVVRPNGRPGTRMFGADNTVMGNLRFAQADFVRSAPGKDWFLDRLIEKTNGQIRLLKDLSKRLKKKRDNIELQIDNIKLHRDRFQEFKGGFTEAQKDVIRGIEGKISQHYLASINILLPKSYRFEKRSRRPGKDLFNCTLNYSYGMLYNLAHSALLLADIDLSMAIFHDTRRKSHAMSLDFIEPFRPWMDAIVMDLCKKQVIDKKHTQAKKDGLWLNKEGRRIVLEAVYQSWEEKILWQNKKFDRKRHILEDAQRFRRQILKQS